MLGSIDLPELFAASAVVFLGLAASVLLAWRELRGVAGLDRFAAAFASLCLGCGVFALRPAGPAALPELVANAAILCGAALLLEGIRIFSGRPPSRRLLLIPGLALVAIAWLTYAAPDPAARTTLSSAVLALLVGQAAWVSRRQSRERNLFDSIAWLSMWSCALAFATRSGLSLAGVAGRFSGGDAISAVAILGGTLASVVWTMAILANANRRLTAQLAARNELFANLLSIARNVGEGPGLDATLESTLRLACAATGATGSSLMLLDENGGFVRGIYTSGESVRRLEPGEAAPLLREGLSGWVARERASAIVPDVERDPRWMPAPATELAIRSTLAVPIASGSALAGILTLDHTEPGRFGEEHRTLIESAAAQIALLLRNVQIADAMLRTARRETLLNAVLRVAARRLEAGAIASAAAEAIARETGWERAAVAIPAEDGQFRLLGASSGGRDWRLPLRAGVIGRAWATGQTQLVPDVSLDPDYFEDAGGVRSELAVPLRQGGRSLGVLDIESALPGAFGPDEVGLAESLAEAIGLGLENARLSRVREELTHAMVHDLRSPMVSIMGSLQFLGRAAGLRQEERLLLEMAQRNAERQAALITAILDVGRLEEGAMPVRPARIRLREFAAEVLTLAAPRAQTQRIELSNEVDEQLPEVLADRGLLHRVLENLVGNALKFSPEGSGPVRVTARESDAAIVLAVADRGDGIDEPTRARLFQKFAPGDHPARGSGLGLAFCRLAVEANGGRLWLEESTPAGSCFAFSVPRAARAEERAALAQGRTARP